MTFAVLFASGVPLVFLYLIHRLDVFNTNRPRLIFLSLGWGVVAFGCSYAVNHPIALIVGRPFVGAHVAPVVEEILKSLILLYLVSRADFTHTVDGAVYGFAAGIGFAIAENMLYLSRVDVNTGVIVAITRSFSSSVLHASTTAIVGAVIGGRYLRRGHAGLVALLVGWGAAIALHMAFNRVAYLPIGATGLYLLTTLAFTGALAVGVLITLGVRQQATWLRRSLVAELGIAPGEARLVQRLADLPDLIAPVQRQFGAPVAARVEALVRAEARLIVDKDTLRRTHGRGARQAMVDAVAREREALDAERHALGMHVMAAARALVPARGRSMWRNLQSRRAARATVHGSAAPRRRRHAHAPHGLYARLAPPLEAAPPRAS